MEENNISNIINNFKNIINTNNPSSNGKNSEPTNSDLNITPDMLNNIINNFNNNSANSSNNDINIDFDTILKIKTIIESLNTKNDPRSNLLYSLKPYLREGRQKKIDQYVNLFKITSITNLFKNEKGDSK